MKIKLLKIIVIIFLLISTIMIGNHKVFAIKGPDEIIIPNKVPGDTELETLGEKVLGVITVIGYAMAIVMLIVMGMKYMGGSVEEKAGYKKSMIPYIVGCVILVTAPTLANIVYEASRELKVSAVIKTKHCIKCNKIEAYCPGHSTSPGYYDVYYCTGCEVECTTTCPNCGATYEGD